MILVTCKHLTLVQYNEVVKEERSPGCASVSYLKGTATKASINPMLKLVEAVVHIAQGLTQSE